MKAQILNSLLQYSRPIQQSHSRSVRTNIYFPSSAKQNNNEGLSSKPIQQECPDVFQNFNYGSATVSASGITASTGRP